MRNLDFIMAIVDSEQFKEFMVKHEYSNDDINNLDNFDLIGVIEWFNQYVEAIGQ